jgi:hypothetical protein
MNNTYIDYPFTTNGINFVSRVMDNSPISKTVANLPAGLFSEMNISAVNQIIGDVSLLTKAELLSELERINDGGTHAFILLGANS